ncbi:ficolin-2 [Culex quinquefasciatus]|uniref:Ficolin-2 n=1 Tax=Culex quinquefasciatus TaxID=7176 RepID=B0XJ59_CULQU|nr:ficolin-2 [Culex quinquefasciatus]|eukprot:XP_001869681.1 ficolin-2 [Culex quinquefasciatus]
MHTFGTTLLLLVLIGIASAKQLIDSRIGEESVRSCRETSVSGVVTIKLNDSLSFQAVCVQRHRQFGDGWMVIQQRTDFMLFYQNWAAYREGFGNFDRSFWLGLEKVYQVTARAPHELVVEYQPVSGPRLYSQVASLVIGSESEKYALRSLIVIAELLVTALRGVKERNFQHLTKITILMGILTVPLHPMEHGGTRVIAPLIQMECTQ